MIDPKNPPSATDPPEDHADYLELIAFNRPAGNVSFHEYIKDLEIAGADEAIADSDPVGPDETFDQSEPLAEAAFAELDDRRRACGDDATRYPFHISGNSLSLGADADKSIYTFLALLSWYGKDAGPKGSGGEKLFEEVCARAAAAYLGGPSEQVKWYVFGFPRRLPPKGFRNALDSLCEQLGEGQGHRKGRPKLPHEKDGKLDVVAWREFHDRRQGKLITFGQCATGADWVGKMTELPQTVDWCTTWMADRPGVWPVRSFFIPHRVDQVNWFDACVKGGILLDRCRIASLASAIDSELETEITAWSAHVLAVIRGK